MKRHSFVTGLLLLTLGLCRGVASVASYDWEYLGHSQELLQAALGGNDVAKGHDTDDIESAGFDLEGITKQWEEDGRHFIEQNDLTYELVVHPSFKGHRLRITSPTLCDPDVSQYSGYLDITSGKHLFFWFFEARNSPESAPLMVWMNGGPGCSSTTGLLFELGPCSIIDGPNVTLNEYSWSTNANMIFLDQPVNVGYSYSSPLSAVDSTAAAAVDFYAFMQLFLTRFTQYQTLPFHIAAESYGGHYVPHFGSYIYHRNKEIDSIHPSELVKINLASLVIGNGITDPYIQFASVPEYACEGPWPIYEDPTGAQCEALRSKVPLCQRLTKACYESGSRFVCAPAAANCAFSLWDPVRAQNLNPYDVRMNCPKEQTTCYEQIDWISEWMSLDSTKKALGVDPSSKFSHCNDRVTYSFHARGDMAQNSAILLPELVNNGIRLLLYAGNADFLCNFIGVEAWLLEMESVFKDEFNAAKRQYWINSGTGQVAGIARSAGGNGSLSGNITYVDVLNAGHMVPFDQPENSLDLITQWIRNLPLTTTDM